MKKLTLIFLALLILSGSAFAQETAPMTMARAKALVERPALNPVPSLIPDPDRVSIDTLDTNDPRIKLILCSDGTWHYTKDHDLLNDDSVYRRAWSAERANPYNVAYDDLPFRSIIWLVDSTTSFCVPYQTKVFSKFGRRRGRQHQGVDLPYPKGTPARAAFPGKVRIAKRFGGYGNLVVLRHPSGLETFYGHLSQILVEPDQWVEAGDVIGLGGSTGRSTGPHLHFETRYLGYAFDPQWLIDFETGTLRHGVFVLRRRYLTPGSSYVPESEDEEEQIYLTEEEERAEEERIARELAAARYHKIRSGDTLSTIARKYGTTVSAICKLNGISPKTTLRVGRTIRVK